MAGRSCSLPGSAVISRLPWPSSQRALKLTPPTRIGCLRGLFTSVGPEAAPALVAAGVPLRNQALLAAVFPMVSDRPTPEQTKALEALIVAGADVNGRGREGMTPLTLAVESGHPEFVKVLLHAGADINLQGQNGRTALICAIMREARSSSPRFVRLLLDSGRRSEHSR